VGETVLADSLEQSCSSCGLKGILSWVGSGPPRLSICVLFGLCACWGAASCFCEARGSLVPWRDLSSGGVAFSA